MKDNQNLIERKDGVSYYRSKKKINCDKLLAIKWKKESIEKMKEIAKRKDIKYQTLMKQILEEYIEREYNNE